jgi:hypothetical protein
MARRQKRFQVVEAAELLEGLGAAVDRDQAALLELPGFDLPQRLGLERPVPDQRQRVGVLGFAAGQALRGVDHTGEFVATGKFAVLCRNSTGDLLQLRMVGQFVIDAHEEFVEFRGYLRHRCQHDDERPVVLAGDGLPRDGLDEFHAAHEAVQVFKYQNRRAGAL